MSEAARENPDNRHQILALSGGGFRGLFGIAFLEHCEAHYGHGREGFWRDRFELIAGTSVGALLAAGLANGKSATMLCAAMRAHGQLIFARRFGHRARRVFRRAPYATEALRKAIHA
ncbi:MAG: patatin-like phospholipase family protein [Allosphingosinicella sp.]